MKLNDKIDFAGVFSIKTVNADGTEDEYTEKNLIMNSARSNMAKLVGGQTTGEPINKIVIGTQGYVNDILDYKEVGENGFETTRTQLFSEDSTTEDFNYYSIPFDTTGTTDEVTVNGTGTLYLGDTVEHVDTTLNEIVKTVSDRTVTYSITIPANSGNPTIAGSAIAYTEAALYAGDEIFSMKCFAARVKENSVKIIISWSIIF